MRLHRLRLTAFGSFPGTEEVDFDALGEAGLFLIHGPTGAGKTTVLDAVCYALYGQVPGQRDSARSLRCDHAPPDRGPSVVLEVTIRERRFRVTRSPAWMRPKLRGEGLVEEKAKVLLEEFTGAWTARSTRSDEAGHLIGDLMGMNADQFCQVAMLPQGEFARFLRADGDDRRKLLEKLFSVKIFTDVEKWLAEHRTQTGRERQELGQRVESVLDRMRGAAGAGLPLPEDAADPAAWADAVLGLAQGELARAAEASAASQTALLVARARLADGQALADRRRRHAAALTRRQELDAAADERADLETILDEAIRADRVLPLIRQAEQRAEAAAKARSLAADAAQRALPAGHRPGPEGAGVASAGSERYGYGVAGPDVASSASGWPYEGGLVGGHGPGIAGAGMDGADGSGDSGAPAASGGRADLGGQDGQGDVGRPEGERLAGLLAELERQRRDEIGRVRQVLPEESRLREMREELDASATALAGLVEQEARLAERLAVLPEERRRAEERLEEARLAAAAVPGLTSARDAAVRLREAAQRAAALQAELERLAEAEGAALAAQAELPALLAAAEERVRGARDSAARIPALEAACRSAAERLAAAELRDALTTELEEAEQARRTAVDVAQERRDGLQAVRQSRIEGMAAELAARLAEGRPCAVCGSVDHPAPAEPAESAPTADDEHAAEEAFEAAQRAREEAETRVAGLSSRLDGAAGQAGGLAQEAAATALAEAGAELDALRAAADEEPALAADADRLAADLEAARERATETAGRIAETRAHVEALDAERARLAAALRDVDPEAGALVDGPDPDRIEAAPEHMDDESGWEGALVARAERRLAEARALAAREESLVAERGRLAAEMEELTSRGGRVALDLAEVRARRERLVADERRLAAIVDEARGRDATLAARLDRLLDEVALIREAADAARAAAVAAAESATAREQAERAAAEAGFAGVEHAAAAVRMREDREAMAQRLRDLDAERATVESVLADPELVAAAREEAPDLPVLTGEHDHAEREHGSRVSERDRAQARLEQLTGLASELDAALRKFRPAEDRHRLARRLAELAGGTASDNRWHMRLSSFVLGERLRQVVEAANERLDRMSGGRYLLRHDLGRSAGDRGRSGGGLALRVIDAWTGVERDPATLSGGESFVTSLALALGLADVVTAEAGGAEIGSLFVDEGFGTLDDETLDDVLDILDGLREGGRSVGVVSHVAELRVRIPAQLRVVKGRSGSTLARH
ncbi:hypothetical protein Mco01_14080 [Microbispora corallina]|uniref:Nuclease SbcCD subunit C n=1 Tax=Microbispora corallina TaxID=83302 RepID=A0ABQ4FUD0_9ACTN|nr:AAA family ATPase [Microbispora corallina]GIH38408.1 hypothetical protein Mco01_14080 [Microbispora corallina]